VNGFTGEWNLQGIHLELKHCNSLNLLRFEKVIIISILMTFLRNTIYMKEVFSWVSAAGCNLFQSTLPVANRSGDDLSWKCEPCCYQHGTGDVEAGTVVGSAERDSDR